MRSEAVRCFAGVRRSFFALRLGAGFLRFAGLGNVIRLDGSSDFAPVDGFVMILLARARVGRAVGAISMPNIPERSSLASTFAPAGPLRVFEIPDPAFAIKSC